MEETAEQHAKLDLEMPASSLKRYFEYIKMAGELKAKCRLGCSKVIRRKNGDTSSMKWHLESVHNGLFREYIEAIHKKNVPIDELSAEERAVLYAKLDLTKPVDSTERYFEYIPEEQKAKCRLGCPRLLTRNNGERKSMIGHLRCQHKLLFQEFSGAREILSKRKKKGQQVESTG